MKATQATEECSQWRAKESKLFSPKGEKTAQQRLTAGSLEDVRWGLRSPGNKQDALHRSIRSIQLSGTEDESGKVHEKEAALTESTGAKWVATSQQVCQSGGRFLSDWLGVLLHGGRGGGGHAAVRLAVLFRREEAEALPVLKGAPPSEAGPQKGEQPVQDGRGP
ncbi:unnamed protein product [Tetraodon nigroviridis]|uniref:Chromosome 16 SCAF15113, whole genome shotgun sequence n=1 Tax=Tetraodon nigroviridis TaxID=99883 RepID=Q4RFP9_TETNG|nr:unnamed protein product [Tetraodon nigroviridis]